jgi:hypothetical protein
VARAIAGQLAGFQSVGVGDSRGEVADPMPLGPIAAIRGAAITAGLFTDGDGRIAALLVNRDYRRAAVVTLQLREGQRPPEHFNGETGSWSQDSGGPLNLPPGGARLVRWDVSRSTGSSRSQSPVRVP